MLQRIVCFVLACNVAWSCAGDPAIAKREHVQNGDRYVSEKKFREAIIEYRQAVAIDNGFGEARAKLADAYLSVNDPERARREYVRAADLLDDADTHVKAGQLLLVGGNFEDARGRADKALAKSPGHVNALILKGSALAGLRDLDGALREIEAAIEEDPARATGYVSRGTLQRAAGNAEEAERSFLEGVKAQSDSAPAHLALANFYWRERRLQESEAALHNARAIAPDHPLVNRFAAIFYLTSGRLTEAEGPLKVLATRLPGSAGELMLADYYFATKRDDQATRVLEQIAAQPGGFAAARLRLARRAARAGDHAEAERLVNEILEKERNNAAALVMKAEMALARTRTEDALSAARQAVAAEPSSSSAHLVLGRALTGGNQLAEAETAFQEALRLNPRSVAAMVPLARVKLALGKPEQTVQLAESALQEAARHDEAQLLLARAQLRLGRLEAAEASLQILTTAFPDAPAVHVEMGSLFLAKGDHPRARRAFDRALASAPGHVPALQGLTTVDLREQQPLQARLRVEKALSASPKSTDLHILAGSVHAALGHAAAAEHAYKQALDLDPNNLRAYTALAGVYGQQQRLGDATRQMEAVVQRRPNDVGARTFLGMLLQMQNRNDEAMLRYQQALETSPRAAVAANNLAWMYAERGERLETALQLAQLAKAELPDAAEVSDTLGWVHYRNNMPALALDPFRHAVTKDPDNAAYHLHLGLAYAKSGEPLKAREAMERALTLNPTVAGADEARAALAAVGQRLAR